MNLLTCETQHGYKNKKSTVDTIYHIKGNLIKNNIRGQLMLGLAKAFGGIDRTKLRGFLYEKRIADRINKNIKQKDIPTITYVAQQIINIQN